MHSHASIKMRFPICLESLKFPIVDKLQGVDRNGASRILNHLLEEKVLIINPIPAGVLENQDTLGGGVNLTPPLNPMFDV